MISRESDASLFLLNQMNLLLLLIKIKENLVFVSEFDLQVRYEKYLIDIGKCDKLTELIEFSLSFK